MKFELNEKQLKQFEEWTKEVYAKGVEYQKKNFKDTNLAFAEMYRVSWESGFPYTGAIGGQFKFIFTPNSIGETVVVLDSVTGEELNLTDYESW